jgi:hypothetical protein
MTFIAENKSGGVFCGSMMLNKGVMRANEKGERFLFSPLQRDQL